MSEIQITIKSSNEANFTVTVKDTDTVLALKEAVAASLASSATPTPVGNQRLIFSGRILKDDDLLTSYKIGSGSAVHLARTGVKAAPPAAAAAAAPAVADVPAAPAAAAAAPAPPAANPFAALLGAQPPANMFQQPQQPLGGPPGLDALLQNPQMAQAMAGLMSNPQFMDMMIASNPQLANMPPEARQFMQSEQFRQMMADPNTLRMMAQMQQMAPLMGGGMNPFAPANGATANPYTGLNANPMNPTGAGAFDPALLQMLMGGGAAGGGLGAPLPPAPANPEEAYQVQLRQLQDMGFYDAAENIRALTATRGNVEAAVEWLFANPPPGHR
ncbi:ubiquitin-like polyubiquitin-binding protein [Obelidium mucronatum]|nr:ubiquitin-like polyubiquitin-binding protein [Obelidium mucronatum]